MFLLKRLIKTVLALIACYLAFALLAGMLPYLSQPGVSGEKRQELDVSRLYAAGGEQGPDRAALLETPQEGFDARIRVLRQAEESLDIVYHCFKDGVTTDYFLSQVLEAADRGVHVRLLLDGKVGGMGGERRRTAYLLEHHPNIEYRIYNPLNPLKPWEWNALLHDKFILADGEVLILGGRNIGDEYFDPPGYAGKVANDRDVLVFRSGEGHSALDETAAYMEELWTCEAVRPAFSGLSAGQKKEAASAREQLREAGEALEENRPDLFEGEPDYRAVTVATGKVSLLHNPITAGVKEPWVGFQLGELALRAEESVLVQTPYTTAGGGLLDVFQKLGDRGTEFRLLTNSMATSPNYPAFSCYTWGRGELKDTGVSLYEYQGEDSIHAKSVLYDGRLCAVGSFNLDDRSIYVDTESMLLIDSPEFCRELMGAVQGYLDRSLLVGEDGEYVEDAAVPPAQVPWYKRLLMTVLSPLFRMIQFVV